MQNAPSVVSKNTTPPEPSSLIEQAIISFQSIFPKFGIGFAPKLKALIYLNVSSSDNP